MPGSNEFKATVMPREENIQQSHGGLPGIHVPENVENIKEFSEYSNASAKELNARIEAEIQRKKAAQSSKK